MKHFRIFIFSICILFLYTDLFAQIQWQNISDQFQLPASVQVYQTQSDLAGKPNKAFYVIADLDDKELNFSVDTTFQRRLTPTGFYEKNAGPYVVVNTTFFSFATNQNLNAVIKDGNLVSYNLHSLPRRGKDTLTYNHPFHSVIGISKSHQADIAWVYTDSSLRRPFASQSPVKATVDSFQKINFKKIRKVGDWKKWKMQTAVGGGPMLVQNGEIKITNNQEQKFSGKAIHDKHPRTAMGYTNEGKLVIMVVEGRNPGVAEGADLNQLAELMQSVNCTEALNLDGGGSSCLLVNGKETNKPSDKEGQRPVPAVFIIGKK